MSEPERGKVILRAPTEVVDAKPVAPKVTKSEREDIMRVIRSREKALKTMATARAAELKSSFEAQISRVYDPCENPIWNEAVSAAQAAVPTRKRRSIRSANALTFQKSSGREWQ